MIVPTCIVLLCLASAVLAWIDLRHGLIPNWINLSIFALGMLRVLTLGGWPAGLDATWQALIVGAVVWLLRRLYFSVRKVQGLGLGDVKLIAASTPWIGITGIPMLFLVATLTALATVGVTQMAGQPMTRKTSIPFGPFLSIGMLVTLALQQNGYLSG